ncbi:MAG: hypothetical protein ACLP7Q_21090 [Isosphaeraceae bacterium]
MWRALLLSRYPVVLIASLAVLTPVMLWGQESPGLSSGSGQGTGSGRSSGIQRNTTRSASGSGPDRKRSDDFGEEILPRQVPGIEAIPRGPGVNVRFPDDPTLRPLLSGGEPPSPLDANMAAQVTPRVIQNTRLITDSYDRSRALEELAREAILSNQLLLAHRALEQAATAATEEPNSLRHDQLVIEVITTTGLLTEALIREGRSQPAMLESDNGNPEPLPKKLESRSSLRLARLEWRRAAVLAQAIINPTYRSEYLGRVAEGMARDSSRVILAYVRQPQGTDAAIEPAKLGPGDVRDAERFADLLLAEAAQVASRIERPIWRNSALERTAISAGESQQYPRAFAVARSIENAEARAQALILVAESQCRHSDVSEATKTYAEVAEAVARVEQDGLRGVLTGFLVDSLISTGRFEDARACLVLYPTESERFVALGAIAEAEGRRGSADRAREWIARDAPEAYRSALYRRVNNGVLAKISSSRQSQFSDRERMPAGSQ